MTFYEIHTLVGFCKKNTFNLSMTLDFCLGNQIQESLVFLLNCLAMVDKLVN